jgi:hypothetical protein
MRLRNYSPSAYAVAVAVALIVLAVLVALCSGCTIKVEPIAKPKPVVKYVHHPTHHRKAATHHGTPAPHLLEPEGTTKLIEHPAPEPSP